MPKFSQKDTVLIPARVIGRTYERDPKYDVLLPNGQVIQNLPEKDLQGRQNEQPTNSTNTSNRFRVQSPDNLNNK